MIATRRVCTACALGALLCGSAARARAQGPLARSAAVGVLRSPGIGGPRFESVAGPAGVERPELEPARIFTEAVAGAYAGIAGYFIGTWAVGGIAEMTDVSDTRKDQIAFAGGIVGAGALTAASVWGIGSIGDQTGSFPVSLAGTAAGVAVGILMNQIVYGHARLPSAVESSRMRWVEASIEALLPSIGATIAFNSTRRFK